jgi:thiol-disulfide isomerase/thioredoxin
MKRRWLTALLMTMTMTATGWTAVAGEADDPPKSAQKPAENKPADPIAARFEAIREEYEAANKRASVESGKAKTEFESSKIYGALRPDEAAFSKRMVDLAATDPKGPGARDALLWVIDKPFMGPGGPYADEFARAVLLLLRHHGDDPEVARAGLELDNLCSPWRDAFLEGLCVRAKGREAKGMARIALGKYLLEKGKFAAAIRKGYYANVPERDKMQIRSYDDTGKLVEKTVDIPADDRAYRLHLRLTDPDATRAEAKRLFEEVVKDFGDVPYATRRVRELEALLKEPSPTWNGEPLKPEDRKRVERMLARKTTLAGIAKAELDAMENLAVGKPAPPIDGTGMDGKPLKLSDYRGKVVVLVFWGTWCGPCMAEVPYEREMAERYKGRPFAILGIDCDGDKDAALKVMKKEGITWPNWNDGDPGEGPIAKSYHVQGFPTMLVLDAEGTIRHMNLGGSSLDKAVDKLLEGIEKK